MGTRESHFSWPLTSNTQFVDENQGLVLEHAHTCGGAKQVNEIITPS
jgi:hypothetical protein